MSSLKFQETILELDRGKRYEVGLRVTAVENPWPDIASDGWEPARDGSGHYSRVFPSVGNFLDQPQILRPRKDKPPHQSASEASGKISHYDTRKKYLAKASAIRVPWLQLISKTPDGRTTETPTTYGAFVNNGTERLKAPICFHTRDPGGTDIQCARLLAQIERDKKLPLNCYSLTIKAEPKAANSAGPSRSSGFTSINQENETKQGRGKAWRSRPVTVNISGQRSMNATWSQAVGGPFDFDNVKQASKSDLCKSFGAEHSFLKALDEGLTMYAAFSHEHPADPLTFLPSRTRKLLSKAIHIKSWLSGEEMTIPNSDARTEFDKTLKDTVLASGSQRAIMCFEDGTDIWDISGKPFDPRARSSVDLARDFPSGEEWRIYHCPWNNPLRDSAVTQPSVTRAPRGTKRRAVDLLSAIGAEGSE